MIYFTYNLIASLITCFFYVAPFCELPPNFDQKFNQMPTTRLNWHYY